MRVMSGFFCHSDPHSLALLTTGRFLAFRSQVDAWHGVEDKSTQHATHFVTAPVEKTWRPNCSQSWSRLAHGAMPRSRPSRRAPVVNRSVGRLKHIRTLGSAWQKMNEQNQFEEARQHHRGGCRRFPMACQEVNDVIGVDW